MLNNILEWNIATLPNKLNPIYCSLNAPEEKK